MNSLGLKIFTLLFGKLVGKDEYNNKYYQTWSWKRDFGRARRWVVYNGDPEPSKVPHKWFNWLHYQTDETPSNSNNTHNWQRAHEPNLTGTRNAYFPKGHILGGGTRSKSVGDYEPWNPNN